MENDRGGLDDSPGGIDAIEACQEMKKAAENPAASARYLDGTNHRLFEFLATVTTCESLADSPLSSVTVN